MDKMIKRNHSYKKHDTMHPVINKHKNICVGLVGMMLVFLAVSFHGDRETDVHSKGGS
jgi:hypothetical protein